METLKSKHLHYIKYGSGKRHLLAFHGFGQDQSAFRIFETSLGKEYTILSFDLFFHGESHWPVHELPVPVSAWFDMLEKVLEEENIEDFGVMGYSLGGKLALATSLRHPTRVKQIILMAPDGVFLNPWYKVATGTALMRSVFYRLNDKPELLVSLINTICRLRLISQRLAKFATSQVAGADNGKRIYYSWVGFRHFTSKRRELITNINKYEIELTMVAGKYDTVIPARHLKAFTQQCTRSEWKLIQTGHNSLLKKYHEELEKTSRKAT